MGRGILKNLLSFLLVLILTIGVVAVLSASTKAGPDAAARYSQEVRREPAPVEVFFAPAQEHGTFSMAEATGGFLLILAVAGAGLLVLARGKDRGRQAASQSYQPRRDRARGKAGQGAPVRRARRAPQRKRRGIEAYPVRRRA